VQRRPAVRAASLIHDFQEQLSVVGQEGPHDAVDGVEVGAFDCQLEGRPLLVVPRVELPPEVLEQKEDLLGRRQVAREHAHQHVQRSLAVLVFLVRFAALHEQRLHEPGVEGVDSDVQQRTEVPSAVVYQSAFA